MTIEKIAWLTDIHLNFLKVNERITFYHKISDLQSDVVLITGDIGEAHNIFDLLVEMKNHLNKPIYFVLGNHDYYFGNVIEIRKKIIDLCKQNELLQWLGHSEIIKLNADTVLLGQDGWADARYGDYDHSSVELNYSRLIAELYQAKLLNKEQLKNTMQSLADSDANQLRESLQNAVQFNCKKIIIATHVPPYVESCLYQSRPTDPEFLPYFSSKATGDVISDYAKSHPNINLLVFSGHTHDASHYKPFNNVEVKVGGAKYYHPEVQELINV